MKYAKRRHTKKVRKGSKALIKTVKHVVNKAISSNIEVKRIELIGTEVAVSSLSPAVAGNWIDLFGNITQGIGSYQRAGNVVKIIGVDLKNYFNNNSTTQLWCRFVILKCYDRAGFTGATSVLEAGTGGVTTFNSVAGMQAMIRPFHPAQCKVVYQKVFKMSANSGEAAQSFTRVNRFIRFGRGMKVKFTGSNTGAGWSEPFYQIGCWIAESPEDIVGGVTCEWTYCNTVYFTDA